MISAPEDYSLSPEQTLAFAVTDAPPAGFDDFWLSFREEVESLPHHWRGSSRDIVNQIIYESIRSVRIVARLSLPDPESPPMAVIVITHGYDVDAPDFDEDETGLLKQNIAVFRVRVRGYPPSTFDVPDLRRGWILHNLAPLPDGPAAWILRGAVADVVQAVRLVRRHFGQAMPIGLDGESFGAGLAVIAAAQLTALGEPPERMTMGLPTFGAWKWRRTRYCNGSGGEINQMLDSMRDKDQSILDGMLLFDSVFHARGVNCPALVKLAEVDDTVPAPTAAAVFNALGSPVKHRFLTRYGHFEGGLSDLRRHAMFEHLRRQFMNPQFVPDKWQAPDPAAGEKSLSSDRA